jgi:hypothetical protein
MSIREKNSWQRSAGTWRRIAVSLAAASSAALIAVPFLGAGGIDNDSPFNLPAFSANGTAGALVSDDPGGCDPNVFDALVPFLGVGSKLHTDGIDKSDLWLAIDGVKLSLGGNNGCGGSGDVATLTVPPFQTARYADSHPEFGDPTAEVQGRVDITGADSVRIESGSGLIASHCWLLVGAPGATFEGAVPSTIDAVMPLGVVTPWIDVTSVQTWLGQSNTVGGRPVAIVIVRPVATIDGTFHIKVEGKVGFTVGSDTLRVDTRQYIVQN